MRAALLAATTSAVLLAPVPVGATGASAAPTVRCPRVPAPAASRPPRPSPPPAVPAQRIIGGAALDTAGLVVPAGVGPAPRVSPPGGLVGPLASGPGLGRGGPALNC
ncbi:D-alanyl-D-alanine carboxypeptidase, partial [Micromonospora arida]